MGKVQYPILISNHYYSICGNNLSGDNDVDKAAKIVPSRVLTTFGKLRNIMDHWIGVLFLSISRIFHQNQH